MKSAARRLARPAAIVLLLGALALAPLLLGCSSGSGNNDGVTVIETMFDVRLTTGTAMRGVNMTLRHSTDFELISIARGDAPLASGTCTENATPGQIRATCATTTSFSAPIDAWHVTLRHRSDRSLDEGILELTCEASDIAGNTFAVTCVAVE